MPPRPVAPPAPPSLPPPGVPIGRGSAKGDPPAVQVDPKKAKAKPKKPKPAKPKKPKKPASSKEAPPAPELEQEEPTPEGQAREVDAEQLSPEEAKKRCAAIYRLEKKVETKRIAADLAKKSAKLAREALAAAEEALEKEIREQRFGPGPLFGPDGSD